MNQLKKRAVPLLLLLALLLSGCGGGATPTAATPRPTAAPEPEPVIPTSEIIEPISEQAVSTSEQENGADSILCPTAPRSPVRALAEAVARLAEVLPWVPDYLVLVNRDCALPEGWETALQTRLTRITNVMGETDALERRTAQAFLALRDALREQGIFIELTSGFRTVAMQRELVRSLIETRGAAYAASYAAEPGHSEHHTGLAADFQIMGRDDPEVRARLYAALPEFGFILRYPEGKEDVTGFQAEPWHLRYVGRRAAEEICSRGLTLEEYLLG